MVACFNVLAVFNMYCISCIYGAAESVKVKWGFPDKSDWLVSEVDFDLSDFPA